MTHPSSLDLEAFACGEQRTNVEEHLGACNACKAFVAKIEEATKAFLAKEDEKKVVPISAAREKKKSTTWIMVLPLVAVAAGVLLWIAFPKGEKPKDQPVAQNTAVPTSTEEPETTFKGGMQLAVVRERAGKQERFTSRVVVHPGDRLRIEVALDRPGAILAGVLADDGTFLPLMADETRGPGTHYSEQAARFDDDPTRGWVLVGPPDAIAKAKAARAPVPGVTSMRLDWEPR